MNGFSTGEEDSRGPTDQICCLIDAGERCVKSAGNASYSKRIQKTVTQRRLNLLLDNTVSIPTSNSCFMFNSVSAFCLYNYSNLESTLQKGSHVIYLQFCKHLLRKEAFNHIT